MAKARKSRRQAAPGKPAAANRTVAAAKLRLNDIAVGSRVFAGAAKRLGNRTLDILPDMPDIRDRIYSPTLQPLAPKLVQKVPFQARDQGPDSSCTGFSLAHIVDFLRGRGAVKPKPQQVSARMLYEMAKRNDEWAGTAYDGSSLRGAIKGLFQNGVCLDVTAPDQPGVKDWALTYDMAKEAKEVRLGAYYRLQPDISDYHAALNEVGAIYVSAQIHDLWKSPKNGRIEPRGKTVGGHAFTIIGYDDKGFLVLNSWGPTWGDRGVAHWCYADWAATVMDAWVLQIGVRAPDAFGAVPRMALSNNVGLFGINEPNRSEIIGHFINMDDGRFVTDGKYGSPTQTEMKETVARLLSPSANKQQGYDHLVIYGHGGLNSLGAEARRIAKWKGHSIFSRNGLYNFHLMWGSGIIDEAFGEISKSSAVGRAGGLFDFDGLFEANPGKAIGARAWRNMKQDARVAFDGSDEFDGGFKGLEPLLKGIDQAPANLRPKLHFVGHSAGSIVIGHVLSKLGRFQLANIELGSIHLMAPACTVEFFKQHYLPYLNGSGALPLKDRVYLYNLTDQLELDDTVSAGVPLLPSYSRSLLYLVSRAYEEKPNTPIAGMQLFAGKMPTSAKLKVDFAKKGSAITASSSHGGFDNDVATMTTIMSRILGAPVAKPPSEDELT